MIIHIRSLRAAVALFAAAAAALLGAAPALATPTASHTSSTAALSNASASVRQQNHRPSHSTPRVVVGTDGSARPLAHRAGGNAPSKAGSTADTALQSSAWSGYRVTSPSGSVSFESVQAAWVEPAITCNAIAATAGQFASFWVGLDVQRFAADVQQDGSTAYCDGSEPVHYLWWEQAPYNAAQIVGYVNAGDTISASTVYTPSTGIFTFTMTDETTSTTYTETAGCPTGETCSRVGAEWIAEAPHVDGTLVPLFPYGTVSFANASATDSTGHTGVIDDAQWNSDSYLEQDEGSLGTPSALDSTGNGFSISALTGAVFEATAPDVTPANTAFAPTVPVYLAGDLSVLASGESDWAPSGTETVEVNPNVWSTVLYSSTDTAFEYKYDLGGTWAGVEETASCSYLANRSIDLTGRMVGDTVATWDGPGECGSSQATVTLTSATVPSGTAELDAAVGL
jgi:hypothetical protein